MTEERFIFWKSLEETEEILKRINKLRNETADRIVELLVSGDKDRATIKAGVILGLNELLELTAEDMEDEAESTWAQSSS